MARRGRIGAIGVAALVAAALAGAQAALPAPTAGPRQASRLEARTMTRAIPARERLCSPRNARISAINGRFGVVVAQRKCGGAVYDRFWLRRSTVRPGARWRVVERRSGSNAHPAGCAGAVVVPIDIRCF